MTKTLKIAFLLPGAASLPIGGFKVVYEYANRLARRGHTITVVHPASAGTDAGLIESGRSTVRFLQRKIDRSFGPESWFPLDPSVRSIWVRSLAERYMPDGDIVIATAWQTAEWAANYPSTKGRGFYLIQHLETWHGMQERVLATWKAPLTKIAISRWLVGIAQDLGEQCFYLPNGLDFHKFSLSIPPQQRAPASVMMLYHQAADKASADGLKALEIVHSHVPQLKVTLFGTPEQPARLPAWIEYHRCPPQDRLRDLYNANAVFVAPSWTEGWGLPASEALMCGAALAVTDVGGHQEYARHQETALLSPARHPEKLASNVLRLIQDPQLRFRLALAGHAYVQQFTWERAVLGLESVLCGEATESPSP
jgi:hypothetical protein